MTDTCPTLDSRLDLLSRLGTDTALELPAGLPYDQWAEVGATLVRVEKGVQWWLADWWLYGERTYGEAASQAAPTGHSADSVREYARVAERIPPSRRLDELSFSHHQAVAALDPPDQDRLLARAATEGMNVHHLRAAAKRARNGNGHEPPPEHDYRCPECGHEWDGPPRP
jgi:hypothetical protein